MSAHLPIGPASARRYYFLGHHPALACGKFDFPQPADLGPGVGGSLSSPSYMFSLENALVLCNSCALRSTQFHKVSQRV